MPRRTTSKRVRVRSKRLDQLDETKLALALWLMAKDTLANDSADNQDVAGGQVIASEIPDETDADNEAA